MLFLRRPSWSPHFHNVSHSAPCSAWPEARPRVSVVITDKCLVLVRHRARLRCGRKHGFSGRGAKKAIVFGMIEREGEVITRVVKHASRKEMLPHVIDHVAPGTHVSTDEWQVYNVLPAMGYTHGKVTIGRRNMCGARIIPTTSKPFG